MNYCSDRKAIGTPVHGFIHTLRSCSVFVLGSSVWMFQLSFIQDTSKIFFLPQKQDLVITVYKTLPAEIGTEI